MNKLTLREKLGYGSGSFGDSVAYGFIGTFLMFFLTTVVKIEPATAGTITVIGAVWNAVFNPLMGYFSDRVKTRFGRRRPVIFAFSIPLALTILGLFTAVSLPESIKPLYYGLMLMLFWTCYTGYFVPYLALGAEYTSDYDDRTILRLFASFFNMLGSMGSMVLPTILVEILEKRGFSQEAAWSFTGGLLGLAAFISILVTVIASRKKDPPCVESQAEKDSPEAYHEKLKLIKIFTEYMSVAKLKPVKYLVFASLFSLIAYEMIMADMVYFLTFNQGFSADKISAFIFIRSIMGIVFIPIVGKVAMTIDKRQTLILFNIVGIVGMIVLKFLGINGTAGCIIYIIMVSICTCIYWQLMPSVFYDLCEYDRFATGHERQGTIVSFQGLVEAIAVGLGSLILGIVLQLAGFDGSLPQQTHLAIEWIENCTTWLPVIFLAGASIALKKYPIDKKMHSEIQKKLSQDNKNK